ncbi:MAG: thioredoxin family protein [Verrucomicrobiae bacterium]|nr:thioredoxin family protein [Verrucomicrobiae bacterium]
MNTHRIRILLWISMLAGVWAASAVQAVEPVPAASAAPVYTVDSYDPKRNPSDDLKAALQQAKEKNKRVLVQAGGDWCGWCKRLDRYFRENTKVAGELASGYVILKVNFSDANPNAAFFAPLPEAQGYPHLWVFDAAGKLLHSQGTGELEEGSGYHEERMLAFLRRWAPPLTAASAQ